MLMQYDVLIIGGGIVGLATALRLKEAAPSFTVALVEKEDSLASHQTGHNSGVIHSGIYYKPGSLKAQNCLRGYRQLLEFCDRHGIAYELCGKIIVATLEKELPLLEDLYQRGLANGLDKIRRLLAAEIREIEPHAAGLAAIHVPYAGIIDYKAVAAKYAELFQAAGGQIFTGQEVTGIRTEGDFTTVTTASRTYQARQVVNCGGLHSDRLAALTQPKVNVRIIPFRGEYYLLRDEKKSLVKHLIYPVPDPDFPFLGVHFTRMVGGKVEAGPNAVFAFKREGYRKTDFSFRDTLGALGWPGFRKVALRYWRTGLGEYYRSFSKAAFTKALQRLVPEVQESDLIPAGAGVRAQACDRTGGLLDDFAILRDGPVVHVLNAPSPAATSSLSIGQSIAEMVLNQPALASTT